MQCLPPFAPAYAHYSFALARMACALSRWMTLAEAAAVTALSWDTVKEIVKGDLGKRYARISLKGVRRIAVDEFHVGRMGRFMTVVIDLESGRVLWIAKGRGADALSKFLGRVRKGRTKIEAVACDMSAASWSVLLKGLPTAAIVFDHFHVIKMAKEKIDDLRRALQREADTLGRRYLKGTRYLLLAGIEMSRRIKWGPSKRPCVSMSRSRRLITSRKTCARSGASRPLPE